MPHNPAQTDRRTRDVVAQTTMPPDRFRFVSGFSPLLPPLPLLAAAPPVAPSSFRSAHISLLLSSSSLLLLSPTRSSLLHHLLRLFLAHSLHPLHHLRRLLHLPPPLLSSFHHRFRQSPHRRLLKQLPQSYLHPQRLS